MDRDNIAGYAVLNILSLSALFRGDYRKAHDSCLDVYKRQGYGPLVPVREKDGEDGAQDDRRVIQKARSEEHTSELQSRQYLRMTVEKIGCQLQMLGIPVIVSVQASDVSPHGLLHPLSLIHI